MYAEFHGFSTFTLLAELVEAGLPVLDVWGISQQGSEILTPTACGAVGQVEPYKINYPFTQVSLRRHYFTGPTPNIIRTAVDVCMIVFHTGHMDQ